MKIAKRATHLYTMRRQGVGKRGIELLLEKGADVNIKNKKRATHLCTMRRQDIGKKVLNLLLEKGAVRKIANDQGLLPRDIAVRSGKRIYQLEPTAVSRISQKSDLFSERFEHGRERIARPHRQSKKKFQNAKSRMMKPIEEPVAL